MSSRSRRGGGLTRETLELKQGCWSLPGVREFGRASRGQSSFQLENLVFTPCYKKRTISVDVMTYSFKDEKVVSALDPRV